jgi:hypothetical protein
MRFPFVSRDRYDEMRQMLESRLAEAEAMNRRLMDRLLSREIGTPLFGEVVSALPHETLRTDTEIGQAAQIAGSRLPSKLAHAVTVLRRRRATPGASNPAGKADVVSGFDEAINEGIASVKRVNE